MTTSMTSNKPYLIRAVYDWIVDNACTPHLLVHTAFPGVQVPAEHVVDERIVLNISPKACRGLHMENDRIVFTARFSGQAMQIVIDPRAVLAIYAKENGQGMEFPEEEIPPTPQPPASGPDKKTKKPSLKLVK